jgi:hypothetical protein
MALKRQIASIGMMMRPISQSGFAAALSPGKWAPSKEAQAEQSEMILLGAPPLNRFLIQGWESTNLNLNRKQSSRKCSSPASA